jgi:hypothetical protein
VMDAIAEARKREGEWPRDQLFWELHPVMEWLMDKLLVRFGRHEAPIIITPQLDEEAATFLFQGVLSNKRSQPLVTEWFGIRLDGNWRNGQILGLEQVLAEAGFKTGLANVQRESALAAELPAMLPRADEIARQHMAQRRLERGQALGQQLREDLRKLKTWYDAANLNIAERELNARGAQAARLYHERKEIQALYKQRQEWLNDTLKTEPKPYLRVALVFVGS